MTGYVSGGSPDGLRITGGFLDGADALHTAFGVGVRALALDGGGGGDEDVGDRCKLICNNQALHYEKLEAGEGGQDAGTAFIGQISGNIARPVEGGDIAGLNGLNDFIKG